MKHVIISLTVDEAIALNNYAMDVLEVNPNSKLALARASRKIRKALDKAVPIE